MSWKRGKVSVELTLKQATALASILGYIEDAHIYVWTNGVAGRFLKRKLHSTKLHTRIRKGLDAYFSA